METLAQLVIKKLHEAVQAYGSQAEVADKLQMHRGDFNNVYNQKYKNFTLKTFEKILPALNGLDVFIDGKIFNTNIHGGNKITGDNNKVTTIQATGDNNKIRPLQAAEESTQYGETEKLNKISHDLIHNEDLDPIALRLVLKTIQKYR